MVDGILETLGTIIYPLFTIIFVLINMMQELFATFAGTGVARIDSIGNIGSNNTGEVNDTGLVFYLLNTTLVKNLLISISFLALFLIVIFTTMAFIKNVYAAQPKSWKEIVGNAFKGLANFIFLPVCCLLGVWLGNILLNAIDGATRLSESNTNLSGQIFLVSAYSANNIRTGTKYGSTIDETEYNEIKEFCESNGITIRAFSNDPNGDSDLEYYADCVDQAMASNQWNYCDWVSVGIWYNLININYIILAGGGIFVLYSMFYITFGMIKRMFMLIFLFIISPALCALYPLDGGSAVGKWKGNFISNTISAYGAIAGMNLFFSISPLIQTISFDWNITGGILNIVDLTTLLLTVAGLYVVKDFISLINGYIGGGDALNDGKGLWSSTKDRLKKTTQKAGQKVTGAFAAGARRIGTHSYYKELKNNMFKEIDNNADLTAQEKEKQKSAIEKQLKEEQRSDIRSGIGYPIKKQIKDNLKKVAKDAGVDTDKVKSSQKEGKQEAKQNHEERELIKSLKDNYSPTSELPKDAIKALSKLKDLGYVAEALKSLKVDKAKYEQVESKNKELTDELKNMDKATQKAERYKQRFDSVTQENMNVGKLYTKEELEDKSISNDEKQFRRDSNEAVREYMAMQDSIKEFVDPIKKLTEELKSLKNGIKLDTNDTSVNQELSEDIFATLEDLKKAQNEKLFDVVKQVDASVNRMTNYTKDMNKSIVSAIIENGKDFGRAIKENKDSNKGDKK